MFENLELPPELSKHLVSMTPILGISGNLEVQSFHILTKYFPMKNNRFLLSLDCDEIPEELSLNVLRKGEDRILIAVLTNVRLQEKSLKKGQEIEVPVYIHSVISFELKLVEVLSSSDNEKIIVYEVLYANGVAGLDPSFNDDVTIAKTLEVMSLTAVDTLVNRRKI
ncbi:MAG: hypothetical protein KAS63_09520 [Candidatus Heimdallarchaeota archaeon]|nr:hypothetical protein [Candidatus Heimdallarchaeota archaeon]MCK4955588.1 hypothetical protein [Candidatus Heimdallarchaeota archaeon]